MQTEMSGIISCVKRIIKFANRTIMKQYITYRDGILINVEIRRFNTKFVTRVRFEYEGKKIDRAKLSYNMREARRKVDEVYSQTKLKSIRLKGIDDN